MGNSTGMLEAVASLGCAPIGGKCGGLTGGWYPWSKRCCGSAKCQKFFGSTDGTMKCVEEHPEQPGCWHLYGAVCQYDLGETTGCYETAAACSSATGKPAACYEYRGGKCEWWIGETRPWKCYEAQGHCEEAHGDEEEDTATGGHLNSHIEDSDFGSQASTEINSTGMSEAVASLGCAPIGGTCGGLTGGWYPWRKKCCGNAKCQKFFGSTDGTMKCVDEQPEQQCVAFNGECGGPGRQTRPCCVNGFRCQKENYFSEVMKCMG